MFEDRDIMKHSICPVSGLDCYLHHKFISGLATPGIFIVFTGVKILLINC